MTFPPWELALRLVKPLRKSVSPFGGDLCFGWLGSPRLYLYKPLGCVSAFWKWMPAGKDKAMHYQKVLKMLESISYLSVDSRKHRLSREYISCASFIFVTASSRDPGSEWMILKGFPVRMPFGSMMDIHVKSAPSLILSSLRITQI